MKNQPGTMKNHEKPWTTNLEPWKTMKSDLEPLKTNLEPWKTMKTDLEVEVEVDLRHLGKVIIFRDKPIWNHENHENRPGTMKN